MGGQTLNLILFDRDELRDGYVEFAGTRARHIRDVLRAKPMQSVRIGILEGPRGVGVLEADNAGTMRLRCELESQIPERPVVDLLLALPRPKVLRRLWAQIAALGVGKVIITNACKVERYYFDSRAIQPETFRPLLIEGLSQAKDTRIPQVEIHRYFRILVEDHVPQLGPYRHFWMADPSYEASLPCPIPLKPQERVLIALGPEGGWTDFERDLLEQAGACGIGLGPRILRSDTATIAVLAFIHQALTNSA